MIKKWLCRMGFHPKNDVYTTGLVAVVSHCNRCGRSWWQVG